MVFGELIAWAPSLQESGELVERCEERAATHRLAAFPRLLDRNVEPDRGAMAMDEAPMHGGQEQPASRGHDHAGALGGGRQHLPFTLAEIALATLAEQLFDGSTFSDFDGGIGIEKFVAESLGQRPAHRGLSGTHEADEIDPLRKRFPRHGGDGSRFEARIARLRAEVSPAWSLGVGP